MAVKGKLINGINELLATPGISDAIGAFANSKESEFPTLDSLSAPFGLTFDQQQQLVGGALQRDATAAQIKLQREQNKADKERLKIDQQRADIERAREEKNDLSESEYLNRQEQNQISSEGRAEKRQIAQEGRQEKRQIAAEGRREESELNLAGGRVLAELNAQQEAYETNPLYREQVDRQFAQQDASIANSRAQASAAAARARLAEIQMAGETLRMEREAQLAAGGPKMDPDYVATILDLSDQKVEPFQMLNAESGQMETPGEIRRAQREIDMAEEFVHGRVPLEALTGVVDPTQIAELAEIADIFTNGSYEQRVVKMQEIFEEEQRLIREEQQRVTALLTGQTDAVNEASGGNATKDKVDGKQPPNEFGKIDKAIGLTTEEANKGRFPLQTPFPGGAMSRMLNMTEAALEAANKANEGKGK